MQLHTGCGPGKGHSQMTANGLDTEIQLQAFFENIGTILPSNGFCRDLAGRSERKPASETENAADGKIKRTGKKRG